MSNFGKNLRYYRRLNGLNQSELGKMIGVGQTTVANYEKGIRIPSIQLIQSIKSALGVDVEDLLSETAGSKSTAKIADKDQWVDTLTEILLNKKEGNIIQLISTLKPNANNYAEIMDDIITPVMFRIGSLWMDDVITIAEEHAATEKVISLIDWLAAEISPLRDKGMKIVAMAYMTEFHTLGMKMVATYLKIRGYQARYLGNNLPTDDLIQYLMKEKPDMLLLSATLISQQNGIRNMVQTIRKKPELDKMIIVIGGQGTQDFSVEKEGVLNYKGNVSNLETWIDEIGYNSNR